MNRDLLSKAIENIDDGFIAEAIEYRIGHKASAPERNTVMLEKKNRTFRRIAAAAAAVCVIMGMGATAYASNYWGIREMLGRYGSDLPESAADIIEKHTESAEAEGLNARIIESFCDANTIIMTIDVTCDDQHVLIPSYSSSNEFTDEIGLDGSMTLGEYAKEKGKELCLVGAKIDCADGDLEIYGESRDSHSISDNEMIIYLKAEKAVSMESIDLICTVYALTENQMLYDVPEDKLVKIPFTVTEGGSKEIGIFAPADANAFPGIVLGDAVVIETPLGLSIRMPVEVTDQEAFHSTYIKVGGISFLGGFISSDGETWNAYWYEGQGEIGDSFVLQTADIITDEAFSEVVFTKK